MIDNGKLNILGVKINAIDYEASVARIMEASRQQRPLAVSALAVHGVMTGVLDSEHRHRLNQLELIVPDGQPVRWAMNRLYGARLKDRVYGPNLMLETCRAAADSGTPIFLFGGKRELLDALESSLIRKFPRLVVAGTLPSRFRHVTPEEKLEIIHEINDSGAGVVFVGLGCPRQEVWAYEFKDHLKMPVLAVGAAFNFHAGLLPQAPAILQRCGLEWFYRFCKEPKRLWQRYLILNPFYVGLLFCQWSGLRRFDSENTVPPAREVLYG